MHKLHIYCFCRMLFERSKFLSVLMPKTRVRKVYWYNCFIGSELILKIVNGKKVITES